ncbi:inositol monophosphatase family protein [Spartinivicinus poritis]|uniref:Inositol-1-monophosphatase n=1 Tax=Spartinivicinus poritis TaxID=2994640 RepID=A0ABT5U2K5_9GAMM|nr:inositol monophosphatase family protein [Spartinivicinus sp. A2-2]MDE1460517.1 inositol monophosphatase family protein [Spartinivicinus sp. A2-2]
MQPMLNIALRAARNASDVIERAVEQLDVLTVNKKGDRDFVTEVDQAAEKVILRTLKKAYPNHGFYGEETGHHPGHGEGQDYLWIIDPLDGTTNFIHGIPHFAVSIACQYKGRIEHAIVLDPIRKEEFAASRGRGAQLNGKRIRVSKSKPLNESLLATGFPFRPDQMDKIDDYLGIFKSLVEQTAGIRRAGSAALDLAYIAAGRYDAYWEFGLNQWDIAAGVLLIQEAGGLVSDFKGGHEFMDNGQVVAGNPKCFKSVLQQVQPHISKGFK